MRKVIKGLADRHNDKAHWKKYFEVFPKINANVSNMKLLGSDS